jgi:hypothetical protein
MAGVLQAQLVPNSDTTDLSTNATTGKVTKKVHGPIISPEMAADLAALEKTPTIAAEDAPHGNAYFSVQSPWWPPLPANIFKLPLWDLGDGSYALDDLDVNYKTGPVTRTATTTMTAGAVVALDVPIPGGGDDWTNVDAGGVVSQIQTPSTNVVWLQITGTTNYGTGGSSTTAFLVIHPPWNVTNCVYDLFATTNLAPSAWQFVMRCAPGQTNLTVPNLSNPLEFFILGLTNSTTGDGMTDAFKLLVAHLDPNTFSSDGTGMSDGWEWQNFGHIGIDPNADPDGDGLTNYQEYMGNTNPNVPDNYNTPLNEPKPVVNVP